MPRKWILIALMAALAGCSKKNPEPVAQAPAGQPATSASANPEPVSPSPPPESRNAEPAPMSLPEHETASRAAVEIPRGVALRVRLDSSLSTRTNRAGDAFRASLSRPVVVDGRTVLPAGTVFRGHVTEADPSGRLKGRAVLGVTLDSFHFGGRDYRVETGRVVRVSAAHRNRNLGFIAGGAGLGAAIGAIAGGGKGAAIGALAGGGAGTAGAAATGKKNVELPAEAALTFSLRAPVRM